MSLLPRWQPWLCDAYKHVSELAEGQVLQMGNWLAEGLPGQWGHFQPLLYSLTMCPVWNHGITCAEPKADALSAAVSVAGDDVACRHYGAGCVVSCYPAGAIRSDTPAGSIRWHQRHHHRADRGIGHIGSMTERERPSRAQQRSFPRPLPRPAVSRHSCAFSADLRCRSR